MNSNLIISGDYNQASAASQNEPLVDALKQFWAVESTGICEKDHQPSYPAIEHIRYDNQRYEVGLPWRREGTPLCTNYELCHNRLRSLHYKLKRQPDILRDYDNILRGQLESGIIEEVPSEEVKDQSFENVHYVSHHAVIRDDKETRKIRIVYDCSAKSQSQEHSLNDCLETGPNFIPKLFDVLVKFRDNPVGLIADIEKAFLMVGVRKEDRDMLRFLWFKNPENTYPELVQMRFCRLVFGPRCSPSLLGSTILYHLEPYKERYPDIVEIIKNSLYLDDLVSGSVNDQTTFNLYEKSKNIMAVGGFNLRKWNSNSKNLMEHIAKAEEEVDRQQQNHQSTMTEEDEFYAEYRVGPYTHKDDNSVKLLGINWNTESDKFLFDLSELTCEAKSLPVSKRTFLKLTAKIFDSLGLLSPFTIKMKMMFQVLCTEGVDWDEELIGESRSRYLSFLVELQHINDLRVPRCYFCTTSMPRSIQIHAFCDASEGAIGTAVYTKFVYDNGDVQVRLMASKTKVAPIKRQSIPRQELLGAVILARLVDTVLKALDQEVKVTYWTHSMTVLY